MRIPASLKKGDKVAIVATAKRMEYDFQPALKVLQSWGLKPVLGKYPTNHSGYFAGTDAQKLEDLNWALNDPDIAAIIFMRGGYGTSRIIDEIGFERFAQQPKWLVGFSDLTCMILHLDSLQIPMVHGPMAVTLGKDESADLALQQILFGESQLSYDCQGLKGGQASGRIVGGNLSMVYESIGAANEIDTLGNFLFLEDVGEQMYGLDRMLNKLKRVGKFEGLKGLLLGDFTDIGNTKDYFSEAVEELILSYFSDEMLVATGLAIGHEQPNLPLVMNRNCEINLGPHQLDIHYL